MTVDGGAPPYAHGDTSFAFDLDEILLDGNIDDYEVLSEEKIDQLFEQQKEENKNA